MVEPRILFPAGKADFQTPIDAAVIVCAVWNTKTKIVLPAVQAMTLKLQADVELRDGSQVDVEIIQGGVARAITLSSAGASTLIGPNNPGSINKTEGLSLVWNASNKKFVSKTASWKSI